MAGRSSPSGRLPLATRQSSAAAIWSEKRLNRVTYLAYLGSKASTRALSQLGQREKPCTAFAPQGRTIWRAPARRRLALSSDVIFELFLRELKADQQFEARALHRRLDLGQAEWVDRPIGVPRLALAHDAVLYVGRQRRRGGIDIGRRLAGTGAAHLPPAEGGLNLPEPLGANLAA